MRKVFKVFGIPIAIEGGLKLGAVLRCSFFASTLQIRNPTRDLIVR